jgi:iron complex outermembrane receptor protein
MNQVAFDWEASWFDSMVQSNIGFRDPFFERDLDQRCYEQIQSSTVLCTTQPEASYNATTNLATFANYTTKDFAGNTISTQYVRPGKKTKRYNRFLPHTGITFEPFGKEHQFFGTYVQEMAAPRTDNLYVGGVDPTTGKYTIVASNVTNGVYHTTLPETSKTFQLGYRFMGENLQASMVLWNSQIKNRIVSSYDPATGTYYDHNVPGVNFSGFDFEANYQILDDLLLYANAGYVRARITSNIPVGMNCNTTTHVCYDASNIAVPTGTQGALLYANTLNKQLTETPKWELTSRVQYDLMPTLHFGLQGKYVGRRNQTEDNNAFVPDYFTFDADVRLDLDKLGLSDSALKLNVDNIFDKHYFGSLAGLQTCWTPVPGTYAAGTVPGCTSYPYAQVGNPRTISATLVVSY